VGVNVCFGEKNHQKHLKNQGQPLVSLDFKGNPVIFTWKHHDTLKDHLKTSSHYNPFVCPTA